MEILCVQYQFTGSAVPLEKAHPHASKTAFLIIGLIILASHPSSCWSALEFFGLSYLQLCTYWANIVNKLGKYCENVAQYCEHIANLPPKITLLTGVWLTCSLCQRGYSDKWSFCNKIFFPAYSSSLAEYLSIGWIPPNLKFSMSLGEMNVILWTLWLDRPFEMKGLENTHVKGL